MYTAVRTHDFGRQTIEDLPKLLKSYGIDKAQLVLPKAFKEFASYGEVTLKHLESIRSSFEQNDVQIHILGCYMDLGNPDPGIRKVAVDTFKKCLSYSKELGSFLVGTETAYPRLNAAQKKIWYPPMMDSLKRLAEEAERVDSLMAVEPVYWHPLQSLEITEQVFDELDSKKLRMIFDPANVLEFPETTDQDNYWQLWLSSLGGKIEAMHVKDFLQSADGSYHPVLLGKGVMNYRTIIEWMKANKPDIVMVREEITPKTAKQDLSYMHMIWNQSI